MQVGVASMWYEGNPCNMHLLDLAGAVKEGEQSNTFPLHSNVGSTLVSTCHCLHVPTCTNSSSVMFAEL